MATRDRAPSVTAVPGRRPTPVHVEDDYRQVPDSLLSKRSLATPPFSTPDLLILAPPPTTTRQVATGNRVADIQTQARHRRSPTAPSGSSSFTVANGHGADKENRVGATWAGDRPSSAAAYSDPDRLRDIGNGDAISGQGPSYGKSNREREREADHNPRASPSPPAQYSYTGHNQPPPPQQISQQPQQPDLVGKRPHYITASFSCSSPKRSY